MATKGFAVVAWSLPRLYPSLRSSTLPSTLALLPCTQVRYLTSGLSYSRRSWPNASSSVISVYGHHQQDWVSFLVCQRRLSTSSFLQDKASPENKASAAASSYQNEKALSFRNIMTSFAAAPIVPMFLGVAGAIPFLALTPPFPSFLPLPGVVSANPIEAQTLYGAVILSFLGAPHWGLAMVGIHASPNHKIFDYAASTVRYVWSVIPSLLAWPALMMTTVPKLQFLICSFGLVLGVDIMFAASGLLPPWYLPLRVLLSGIVILCLSASLLEVIFTQKQEAPKMEGAHN